MKLYRTSSENLLSNVDTLNNVSVTTAASLEETAAALEEITATIINNTENVMKMSGYAEQLSTSAAEGKDLATRTSTAMNEINEQVAETIEEPEYDLALKAITNNTNS